MRHMDVMLVVAGGVFAMRYLAPLIPQLSHMFDQGGLLYLANSPLVPFAAIMGFAWVSDPTKILFSKRIMGIVIMVACFIAMAVMVQRAPMILTAIGCLVILAIRSAHKPIHSMVIGAVLMACLWPVAPIIIDVFQGMIDKTLSVGWNNRADEFMAVMTSATLFGEGWGAVWQSPAVGDMWVRYTHNIISYYWLKAGIIGAFLTVVFVAFWAREILKIIRENPALGIAIATPFIIHVTLYSGFKTLDFACLLALCGAWRNRAQS
jgi:O-antigen ligase